VDILKGHNCLCDVSRGTIRSLNLAGPRSAARDPKQTPDLLGSEYSVGILFNSWIKLPGFLEQRGTLPDRFEEIDPHVLAEFDLYCCSSRTSLTDEADAPLIALPMLLILLVNGGYHRTALSALIMLDVGFAQAGLRKRFSLESRVIRLRLDGFRSTGHVGLRRLPDDKDRDLTVRQHLLSLAAKQ
jgi:hypothetical protein